MFRVFLFVLALTLSPLVGKESGQPQLPKVTLSIAGKTVHAEVADEDSERQMGLMHREALEKDSGMLFLMPSVSPASFWMKNTPLPLSIAFISPAGVILEIHDLEPFNETPVRSRFPNVAYALEMRRDWFSDNGILPGSKVSNLPPRP